MKGRFRMWPLLHLLYLSTAWPTGDGARVPDLPFAEHLDPNRLVLLQWGFDDTRGNITFTVSIQTTGWISFGLSPYGNMIGADMVIGGVGPDGIYFTDRHATGNFLPIVDSRQSYELLSMTEVEGQTSMTFQRPMQTCDDKDFHITGKPIKLIYAYGETDQIEYHSTRRGTKEVNLLNYMPRVTLPDREYLDFTMDNITVPAIKSHYHCRVRKMPRLNVTHHVYRIEPVIENVDLVHHMLLYGCPTDVTEDYDGGCYTGNIVDTCFKVTAAWGVGGGVAFHLEGKGNLWTDGRLNAFELPEDAGIPIGGNNSDILYRLEIHYSNPTRQAGRRDSSGLRMYYTSELRRHNVGTLATGMTVDVNYKIPPGATQFHAYGTCNTSLFSQHVDDPAPDLHVFALFLHTHLTGRKVRAALFRDGKQVDSLAVNEHYDFELQEWTNLGNIKTIKPNDEILVECTYNTTGRTGYTKMGLSTTEEMCLAFLLYYPESPVHSCWSFPVTNNIENIPNVIKPADQNNISDYENILRTNPQIQVVSDVKGQTTVYDKGTVRKMKDTPTFACQDSPSTGNPSSASRGMHTSCNAFAGGSAPLLLPLLLWGAV